MTRSEPAKVGYWLTEPLNREVSQAIDGLARLEDVEQIAVMPDAHLAKEVCVGLAVATRTRIYPAAVGSDIGCGMAAIGARFGRTAGRRAPRRSPLRGLTKKFPRLSKARGNSGAACRRGSSKTFESPAT